MNGSSHMWLTHTDEGALNWLVDTHDIHSFFDLGCGTMGMIELSLARDLYVLGLDGDKALLGKVPYPNNLIMHDLTTGIYKSPKKFDAIWCVEVLEHIPQEFVPNVMQTLLYAISINGLVIMTHALPGTESASHVNCQKEDYWLDMFDVYAFDYLPKETEELKKHSTMQREFIQKTGKVFRVR